MRNCILWYYTCDIVYYPTKPNSTTLDKSDGTPFFSSFRNPQPLRYKEAHGYNIQGNILCTTIVLKRKITTIGTGIRWSMKNLGTFPWKTGYLIRYLKIFLKIHKRQILKILMYYLWIYLTEYTELCINNRFFFLNIIL